MMKWNGSIYYNAISQDNVEVDRVVLELSPCPVIPSHYWQRPRTRRAEGMGTRRWAQGMGSSYPGCCGWLRIMQKAGHGFLALRRNKFCPEEVLKILLFYAVTIYTSSYLHALSTGWKPASFAPDFSFAPSFKRCFIISGNIQVETGRQDWESISKYKIHAGTQSFCFATCASSPSSRAPTRSYHMNYDCTRWVNEQR